MKKFKFIDKIIEQKYVDSRKEYTPTMGTDFGEEINLTSTAPEFLLENLIFHKTLKISIPHATKITIKNCLFNGALIINPDSNNTLKDIEVFIYKTVANQNININRLADFKSINVDCCVIESIYIRDVGIGELSFFGSEILEVGFDGTKIKNLEITDNFLSVLKYEHLQIEKINIDITSILAYHKKLNKIRVNNFYDKSLLENWTSQMNEYEKQLAGNEIPDNYKTRKEYERVLKHNIKVCRDSISDHQERCRQYLLNFYLLLKKSIHASIDNYVLSDLNYFFYRNKKYNPIIWTVLFAFGFFYKPSRVIFSSILSVIFFGIVFYMISHANSALLSFSDLLNPNIINTVFHELANSVYFSGITFYTVGYSDLLDGFVSGNYIFIKQLLVIIEAAIGIIFSSAILISFMNKYITQR